MSGYTRGSTEKRAAAIRLKRLTFQSCSLTSWPSKSCRPCYPSRQVAIRLTAPDQLLAGEIFKSLAEAEVLIEDGGGITTRLAPTAASAADRRPGNGFSAIATFRFRFAPPPGGNGNGGDNALTINTDHSVGAGQDS